MLFYITIAIILGILAGTITGLFPGVHINLIAIILLTLSTTLFTNIPIIILIIFLVAMAITHTFIDYIPSVFLGAPDEDTFLSILPGHNLLLKKQGYSAIIYTLFGSITAIPLLLILFPIFIHFLNPIYPYIQSIIPYILILTSISLIYFEKNSKLLALFIFLLSGILGIITFNISSPQPLLPLFTGLFGTSSLITSLIKKQKIPQQKIIKIKNLFPETRQYLKAIIASLIGAPLVSFLPGLGTGQAAVIGSEVIGDLSEKEFLIQIGAINTLVIGLSFFTLYAVDKARTGTTKAIQQLISTSTTILTFNNLYYILATILITGIIAFFLTIFLAKFFSIHIHKINYKFLSYSIILLLTILTLLFSHFYGILILITATALGLTCIQLNIKRTHLMGALIIPIVLLYLI
jgi:putative membrane protein